jgi:hypothetical protein
MILWSSHHSNVWLKGTHLTQTIAATTTEDIEMNNIVSVIPDDMPNLLPGLVGDQSTVAQVKQRDLGVQGLLETEVCQFLCSIAC